MKLKTTFIPSEKIKNFDKKGEKDTPFGPVGQLVDIRTYRRFLPEKLRRETLGERNARVVDYNIQLGLPFDNVSDLLNDANHFYDSLGTLKYWPSGRTAWVGGTKTTELHPAANFNCSFLAINRLEAFIDLAELLMLGTGVGFRLHSRDLEKLPDIKNIPSVHFSEYKYIKNKSFKDTQIALVPYNLNQDALIIDVGDSRKGWLDSIRVLLALIFQSDESFPHLNLYDDAKEFILSNKENKIVEFNFNYVRPKGSRIKGFGGTASGPQALKEILRDILQILKDRFDTGTTRVLSIDAMDIACASARGIIAGSSSRSALIPLFEQGDLLCRNSKKGLYTNPEMASKSYRAQSNITENIGADPESLEKIRQFAINNPTLSIQDLKVREFIKTFRPDKIELTRMFETVRSEGEPGFDNWARMCLIRFYAAIRKRPQYTPEQIWEYYCDIGTNPCHEIILSAGFQTKDQVSFCNLTTIAVTNHIVYINGVPELDVESLKEAFERTVRIAIRQTCVDMPYPHMDECQKEERLLGVSSTGWRDLMDILGWETNGSKIKDLLQNCKKWANEESERYSKKLGIPTPLLVTTIKPEGTASQIMGTSSGLHWDWAPYYLRRIRMSSSDALAKTLIKQGFNWYPEIYDLETWYHTYARSLSTYLTEIGKHKQKPVVRSSNVLLAWLQSLASIFSRKDNSLDSFYDYTTLEKEWSRLDVESKLKVFSNLLSYEKEEILDSIQSVVLEFPVKSPAKICQSEVTALEQLENMRNFTLYYCDHMPSSTITVKDDEWEQVIDWVYDNWDTFTTAAFLPYFGGNYPLLPFQTIDEEDYKNAIACIPDIYKQQREDGRCTFLVDQLTLMDEEIKLEDPDDVDVSPTCSTGTCPVR
jgi:adenosylcobalamin-dependent ribonucleoside-triphosphate reductase